MKQKIRKMSKIECKKALTGTKNGKAVDPDDKLVGLWKCLGEKVLEF